MADDDLNEYGPAEGIRVELRLQNHPSDTGEDNIIKSYACLAFWCYNQN